MQEFCEKLVPREGLEPSRVIHPRALKARVSTIPPSRLNYVCIIQPVVLLQQMIVERKPTTFNVFRQELNNIDGTKLRGIIKYLDLSTDIEQVGSQYAETIPLKSRQAIRSYLRIPDVELEKMLRQRGFLFIDEYPGVNEKNISRTVYVPLNIMFPYWKDEAFFVASKKHRKYLIPPWIARAIELYNNLSYERQMLGVWRSQRKRNVLPLDNYLFIDLKEITDEKRKDLINNGITAQKIFNASNIIKLSDEDIEMLANLSVVDLTMRYVYLVRLAFIATKYPKKSREEAIAYMRLIIGGLKFKCESEGEFTTKLKSEISAFVAR
jgi:hypothetical protein